MVSDELMAFMEACPSLFEQSKEITETLTFEVTKSGMLYFWASTGDVNYDQETGKVVDHENNLVYRRIVIKGVPVILKMPNFVDKEED